MFGDWETVEEATADKEGLKKHTCRECGYEETEIIPKLSGDTTPSDDDGEKKPVNTAVIVVIVVVGVAGVGTGAFFVLKKFKLF